MSIGTRIKEARMSLSMTQEELAKQVQVTKGAIANYENSVSIPKPDIMYKLFSVLQCDANFLYQDEFQNDTAILSPADKQLIEDYKNLDEYGKKAVDNTIATEKERCEKQRQEYSKQNITQGNSQPEKMFWAARSADNTPPRMIDYDEDLIERLKQATPVTREEDL